MAFWERGKEGKRVSGTLFSLLGTPGRTGCRHGRRLHVTEMY